MKLIGTLFSSRLDKRLTDLRPRLFRAALGLCGDAQQADDLVQSAMEKALLRMHSLKRSESLEAWVFTILTNCYRDQCRRRDPEEPVKDWPDAGLPDMGEILDAERQAHRVRHAIGCLKPEHREVLILVDIEGFSYAEVGDILQIPMGTVMSRLSRGRLRLKSLLLNKSGNGSPRARNHLERVK